MARLWQQIIKGEKGQALPIVLCFLLVGGLLIAPSLSYAATSLNAGEVIEKNLSGLYAADAGVEHALRCIEDGSKIPKTLPENVNQLEVKVKSKRKKGTYTMYCGELTKAGKHSDYLDVTGDMAWDGEAEAYQYTITVTWQAEPGAPTIHLEEIGARLPLGQGYQPGSAASFDGNLSIDVPDDILDGAGAHMLNWELPPPHPAVSASNPIATQSFYVTGEEGQSSDYAWVLAKRHDIGEVGEIIGRLYRIEATSQLPGKGGEKIIKVEAFVLKEEAGEPEEGEEEEWEEEWEEEQGALSTHIISWQISPQ